MPPSAAKTKGSGLHCDCNARWLSDWSKETKHGDMTCASPPSLTGLLVTQLQAGHFLCGTFIRNNNFLSKYRPFPAGHLTFPSGKFLVRKLIQLGANVRMAERSKALRSGRSLLL